MKVILTDLGFRVSGTEASVKVAVPSWRPDVEDKADLVEEIMRIAGLERVLPVPFPREPATVAKPVLTLIQKRTRLAKRALASRGLIEAVTWSFISHPEASHFGGGSPALSLANPIASDLSDMRPSLLPGLLKAIGRNVDRGLTDIAIFEVGQIFRGDRPQDQSIAATAVRRGLGGPLGSGRFWRDGGAIDAFDSKADAMALLEALGVSVAGLQVQRGAPSWFHPGRSGVLQFGPKAIVGAFGEIHPRVLEALDVKGPVVACEINLDALPPPKQRPTRMKPKLILSEFQPVSRDFAFIVDDAVPAGEIVKITQAVDRALISDITVFDVYRGTGVPQGKTSIAIAVTLQPMEKTLTDSEIDAVSARIVADVAAKMGKLSSSIFPGVLVLLSLALSGCQTVPVDELPKSTIAPMEEVAVQDQEWYIGELSDTPHPIPLVDRSKMRPELMRQAVPFVGNEAPGTIIVDIDQRFLYFVEGRGLAIRYGIGVGRLGFSWRGVAEVGRKGAWPDWSPTSTMRRIIPNLPARVAGGIDSPLGARALYLYQNGQDILFRIHGTNEPWSIGEQVSSGCIRLLNEDIYDLYGRTKTGATVIVRNVRKFSVPAAKEPESASPS
jgi:lipoprotein-anchoring transpeptidase ErfK/SrfK